MAQAGSSAQREPSMEEILASIRRIIEDSDAANVVPAGKRADEADHADGEPSGYSEETDAAAEHSPGEMAEDVTAEAQESVLPDESPTVSDVEQQGEASGVTEQATRGSGSLADVLREVTAGQAAAAPADAVLPDDDAVDMDAADEEIQSFRDELSDTDEDGTETGEPDEREHETSGDDSSMNALSMADIQAQVARQSDPEEGSDSAGEEQTLDSAGEEQVVAAAPADAGSANAGEVDDDEDYAADTGGAGYQDNGGGIDDTVTAARMDVSETHTAGSSAVAMDRPATGNQFAARAPIISEMPGRQVAAAFDELSEAFSHTKKFDEMAEEMMRPMLQDWLDNNLPTLVERLVREEIDRVARGVSR